MNIIPSRTLHNLFNAMLMGFSGNDIHQYMDRAAKSLRQKHRQIGHNPNALTKLLIGATMSKSNMSDANKQLVGALFGIPIFKKDYSSMDIFKTWLLHKSLDGAFSGFAEAVKKKNQGYGIKDSTLEIIKKLKTEVMRL